MRTQPQLRQIFWLGATNRRLLNWLRTREALVKRGHRRCDPKALWISTNSTDLGRRPHDNTLGNNLREYAARAGIKERIHPHMFRHAFARSRVLGSAETSAIASLLGHSNIESSLIYTRLYGKHLRDAYARFMPDPETEEDGRTAKSLRRLMAKN